jgi:hypothetical protein
MAESVVAVLSARGIDVPDEVWLRIDECTSLAQMKIWLRQAVTIESADDLIARDDDLFDRR